MKTGHGADVCDTLNGKLEAYDKMEACKVLAYCFNFHIFSIVPEGTTSMFFYKKLFMYLHRRINVFYYISTICHLLYSVFSMF